MSIPTYNLYNFVAQALENKYLVKYFHPWGQKNFRNITDNREDFSVPDMIETYGKKWSNKVPVLLCHDQEPLDFDYYNDNRFFKELEDPAYYNIIDDKDFRLKCYALGGRNLNFRWDSPDDPDKPPVKIPPNTDWIVLHSELNSPEVQKYENSGLFKTAYWWAHAPIAIDWYRFARYDTRLARQSQDIKANFLVYAQGTTGKRAYRKIFLEHLEHIDNVQLGSINQYEITSDSSATYDAYDFAHTNCSIVLETVYDQRIHLTEKTLRPLACGHPFMILNGPGALETIRSYGFKTFQPYINESYDKETAPMKRMDMVLREMRRINSSSAKYQKWIWDGCNEIAEHNKKLFFDDKFIWRVKTELRKTVRTV